ncbi:alanyl-tRNA synthetase [Magnaporthiopsis poae ATCC 64411]|uniref:Alanine--tRNA ligase n=1 Tax=Magnaporthiopsis poae (strain ATCC 64411 / 73-15) TaxID=644358 RepID=A0A0C4E5F5_MAGP6|nr:alanyl-tRNA synthetase [Magnaporthiopsis poae ATCC 64411]
MSSAVNSRRHCWQKPALGLLSQSRPGAPPHLRRLPPLAARAHLYLPLDSSLPPSSSSRLSTLAITTRPATRTVPVLVPALPSCRRSLHLRASSPALSPTEVPAAAATTTIMGEPKWSAAAVRTTFLEFFQERGHTVVPSGSVVPHNDPTLLFTNAGMNQFKPVFLGTVGKTDPMASLKRAVDTQKARLCFSPLCIRAGGKHNDLDDVGKDSYHHTFFEMLGNWSFGDYFKKEAIAMAWELLTKVYGLDTTRLYVTYFEGNPAAGLEPDLEAKNLWLAVGVPENHILPGNMKDNFWEMGDQGPCGPCSEIHYDKVGGGRNAAHLVNQDDPLVVEIWNIVFMQFDRQQDRSLKSLPAKHIDTGMGFERLVAALQDKTSNYGTDVFAPLFARIQEVTGAPDHIRLMSLLHRRWCSAQQRRPAANVVRRVLRRGVRYARKYFNADIGGFFSQILPTLVEQLGSGFPELAKKQKDIQEILDEEEEAFARTLDRGEKQFEKYAAMAIKAGESKLSGSDVWRLYDTFGFPEDLTKLMAEERGITIDEAEVSVAREKAREASKSVKEAVQTFAKLDVHRISELEKELKVPRPDSEPKFSKDEIKASVLLLFTGKDFIKTSKDLPPKTPLGLLLDRTNFYAESGGQVADTGRIVIDGVAEFNVLDVQEYGGYVVHNGYLEFGELTAGDTVVCEYDERRRLPIRNNHTGTHILNHSLREVLGDEVNQKGSLVDEEKLRFDFSHKAAVTLPELRRIEDLSNAYIRQNCKTYAKDVTLDLARQIEGVRAVFGETYPDPVRVVSVGIEVDMLLENPKNPEWRKVSVEFCGGTHVDQTGIIKDMIIVEESGIAKGIRRIVAYTGDAAHQTQRDAANFSERIAALEKLPLGPEKEAAIKSTQQDLDKLVVSTLTKDELRSRFGKIQKDVTDELKKRQKAESKKALDTVTAYFKNSENADSNTFVGHLPISANSKALADVVNHFKSKDKEKSVYVFGGSADEGAVVHGVYVGTALSSKGVTAEQWANAVCGVIGGKSGGKEPTRQGQGTAPEKLEDAVREAERYLSEKLKNLGI